ncbi:hypothetical protein [Aureimonas sp. AU4]|uniref:hypothetical protein n=1 Tax=Aureimonas sp. AU4 TaxID=1638163 RepID=UPI000783FFA6|nr:hypothetical protein [Aureimonas sp. AU4]
MNGISLGEFAAVMTALGGVLTAVFVYTKFNTEAQAKTYEARVTDLQTAMKKLEDDGDERMTEIRRDFERQLQDVKQAMLNQARTIERQEIMLADYARHVGKLERIMAGAQLAIPEFETSPFRGGGA